MEWIESLHWAWAILFFWCVGAVRTSLVYLLGWLASAGGSRISKIHLAMQTPLYGRARAFINRWGTLAVPLCFLTVGFQTAVIITTGFTRMPLARWIPAMLLGTFIWAVIYATVGMALIWIWLKNPLLLALVLLVLLLLILLLRLHKPAQDPAKKN